jgi:PPM family protein phosphatase
MPPQDSHVGESASRNPPRPPEIRIDLAGLTHRGRVRPNNEDHFLVIRAGRYLEEVATNLPPGSLAQDTIGPGMAIAVADGMGAHAGGEVASLLAITTQMELLLALPDWILRLDESTRPVAERRALDRFHATHAAIVGRAAEDPRLYGMGTTMTVAMSLGLDLRITHVGDTRAYLLHEGRLVALTHDHSRAQELLDEGAAPAVARRSRHLLTRSLGNKDPRPEVSYWRLAAGDRLLVCTDGLTDMVGESVIAAELGRHGRATAACRALVRRALEAGGLDNVTVGAAFYAVGRRRVPARRAAPTAPGRSG